MSVWRSQLMSREFVFPSMIFILIGLSFVGSSSVFLRVAVIGGIGILCVESWQRIREQKWNLDYIAFLALFTAAFFGEWLSGAVLSFMVSVSAALELFGTRRAEKTLRNLFEKIPKEVLMQTPEGTLTKPIQEVAEGEFFLVRTNEMVPLDASLVSDAALLNESNLTGEMEPMEYRSGRYIKSGCVNLGSAITLQAKGTFERSSYRKILTLVEEGKKNQSPLVRLAERSNWIFTLVTLAFALGALFLFRDWERFLAVLVIATPCPLLIAAPVSFLGGLSRAARNGIIIKSPGVLEALAKTKTLFFDKTGTLTLGEPELKRIEVVDGFYTEKQALAIAASLEWSSLHPIAKTLVKENGERGGVSIVVEDFVEKLGEGIAGTIDGKRYRIGKGAVSGSESGIVSELMCESGLIARFYFDDTLKEDVGELFRYFRTRGYSLGILTGDKRANAHRIFGRFAIPIYAECSPDKKSALVTREQGMGKLVGMVGDGMNDAPALALADVGIVFSGTENSASIEAADVAILGRDAWKIRDAVHIGRRSYQVARQSIVIGIGLSCIGMLFAFLGFIPPVYGAVLQEVIDVVVIVNALRATY